SSPFSGGFTQTAFTVTSDETEKTRTELLSDEILDAWSEVDFCQFQYIDRVIIKSDDGARWHVGIVAQRVKEAFERHGLDPFKYALLCYDEWGHEDAITSVVPAVYDENGVVLEEEKLVIDKAETLPGQRYGIRYEQALVMEATLQRRNYSKLEERVRKLEEK
ncbi:MAG: tail fiber domain-containing protein, partial [Acholeplasmataceae bacterium]|nr:tail fiber domain-containing protein [Acholeplasmataceae bacterium]